MWPSRSQRRSRTSRINAATIPALLVLFQNRESTTAGKTPAADTANADTSYWILGETKTRPQLVAAADRKVITTLEAKQTGGAVLTEKDAGDLKKAKDSYEATKNGTSVVGLAKPLFR